MGLVARHVAETAASRGERHVDGPSRSSTRDATASPGVGISIASPEGRDGTVAAARGGAVRSRGLSCPLCRASARETTRSLSATTNQKEKDNEEDGEDAAASEV